MPTYPAFPGRTYTQVRQPDQDPVGTNRVHWVVEEITATQQMGTHLDGLNHLHDGDRTYNGHRLADVLTPYGTSRLGIDTLPQIVTRGLCLDVAAVRGLDRLPPGEVITPADAVKALAAAANAVLMACSLFHVTDRMTSCPLVDVVSTGI